MGVRLHLTFFIEKVEMEFLASILGIISIWLIIERKVWAFPVGIVMVLLYAVIFFQQRYYAGMALQFFFVVMQVMGWVEWVRGAHDADDRVTVFCCLSRTQWLISIAIVVAGTGVIGYLLEKFTDPQLPYLDAATTSLSLVAQWWMNRRQIQHWQWWMVVNVLYIYQMWAAELYWTVGLYAILLAQAAWGYRAWKAHVLQAQPDDQH